MRCLTAEMVIWQCRGSSSIVEVASSLAAFVGVLRGAERACGDGRLNCRVAVAGGQIHLLRDPQKVSGVRSEGDCFRSAHQKRRDCNVALVLVLLRNGLRPTGADQSNTS